MKKIIFICMSCAMIFMVSSCGKTEKADNKSTTIETELNEVKTEPEEKKEVDVAKNSTETISESKTEDTTSTETISEPIPENVLPKETESNKESDPYVGEYDSDKLDGCGYTLQIKKNDDETYHIQIGIYHVVKLYQCEGKRTEEGIAFCAPECEGKDISGMITLDGDVATVKFTSSDWSKVWDENEFTYHKISDTPNIYIPEYKLEGEALGSDADRYVGSYNSYDVNDPDLQIKKNEDGTYHIQIGIFRTINLYSCKGEQTEEGIVFSTTEWGDYYFSGVITFVGDTAIVKFTSEDWNEFGDTDIVYPYYKTSNEPNIHIEEEY